MSDFLKNCLGFEVRGSEGLKIGKIVRCDADALVVEHGIIKVDDFVIPVTEVASTTDREVYLRQPAQHYAGRDVLKRDWSPWHTGKRGAEARDDIERLDRADREHRLGAQTIPALADQARDSHPARTQGGREGTEADQRGEPAVQHPEDEPLT